MADLLILTDLYYNEIGTMSKNEATAKEGFTAPFRSLSSAAERC